MVIVAIDCCIRHSTGYVGYQQLLLAEQNYQQAAITLIQAQTNRYGDTAALYQALGGGWWNRDKVASNDEKNKTQ